MTLHVARVPARYCDEDRKKNLAILRNPRKRAELVKRVGERQVAVMAGILGVLVLR